MLWGGHVNKNWWQLALWRANNPGSSTLEGRKRKEGETRGRKPAMGKTTPMYRGSESRETAWI